VNICWPGSSLSHACWDVFKFASNSPSTGAIRIRNQCLLKELIYVPNSAAEPDLAT